MALDDTDYIVSSIVGEGNVSIPVLCMSLATKHPEASRTTHSENGMMQGLVGDLNVSFGWFILIGILITDCEIEKFLRLKAEDCLSNVGGRAAS